VHIHDIHPLGMVFADSILRSEGFAMLAAFVALNTVMYVVLAIAKMLPKVYFSDLVSHRNRRSETRSIHPDAPA
jgi:hypothetical protein